MSKFFSRLSYSFGNEDWRTEREALKIKKGDRVLSITASGDRPLNLLLDNCEEIVSVDANPIQNHLLNLKCIAMRELDYDQYIAFLGVMPDKHRLDTFKRVFPYLDKECQNYWSKHLHMIEKGVLYQGLVEKRLQTVISPVFRFFRGKKIRQLFEFEDIEEQREFVKSSWDKFYWRKVFDLAFNSVISRLIVRRCIVDDPGLYDHLDGSMSIGTYLYRRMHESLMKNLAKESILFSLIFNGSVDKKAFSPYLTEEGTKIIRKRVNRIRSHDSDIVTFLESTPDNSFDCFSLSDVASYLSPRDFLKMMTEIERVARPGARFSIRQFLSNHKVPLEMQSVFYCDAVLQKQLEAKDRCFVYRYMAGVIEKSAVQKNEGESEFSNELEMSFSNR